MGLLDLLLPRALRGLRRRGAGALREPAGRARPAHARRSARAAARRSAWPVEPVPRVRGTAARVRARAGRGRLRRGRDEARLGVEGGRAAATHAEARGDRRRGGLERPGGRCRRVRAGGAARELWRGHNPARELAAELARRLGLPARRAARRARGSAPQRGLRSAERRRNVAGAFRAAARAGRRRARRRRLHHRSDRVGRCAGAPKGRGRAGRGRHVRPGAPRRSLGRPAAEGAGHAPSGRVSALPDGPSSVVASERGGSVRLQVKGKNVEVSDSL